MPVVAAIFALTVLAEAVFGKIWTPKALRDFQNDLLKHATSVDTSVKACTKLDPAMLLSWNAFYAELVTFAKTDYGWISTTSPDGTTTYPGGDKATADRAQKMADELYAFAQKIEGKGCALSGPNIKPDDKPDYTQILTGVKYVSIAVGFVAAAYVAKSVVGLIPAPARRSTT